jgi:hypothetical protein
MRERVPFPSSIPVLSGLIYPPRPPPALSEQQRRAAIEARNFIVQRIKGDQPVAHGAKVMAIEFTVQSVLQNPLAQEFLTGWDWLVPVPGHAPRVPGAHWASLRIAEALHAAGVGTRVEPCLIRVQRVNKSAFAPPGQRPSARDHYDSFRVEAELGRPASVLLVDDVVTRGATIMGGVARLAEAFGGQAPFASFAVARTETTVLNTTQEMLAPQRQVVSCDLYGSTSRA